MSKFAFCALAALAIAIETGAQSVTTQQADQAMEAFNRTYWNASGRYFYKRDDKTGVLDFWLSAHAWETVMDAYVRTGNDSYRKQIKDVYDGFIARHGADWTQNDYNDDIAWWVIASARAFEVTGETRYLNQAKSQFDWVYRTQRDTVKGGIWWMRIRARSTTISRTTEAGRVTPPLTTRGPGSDPESSSTTSRTPAKGRTGPAPICATPPESSRNRAKATWEVSS